MPTDANIRGPSQCPLLHLVHPALKGSCPAKAHCSWGRMIARWFTSFMTPVTCRTGIQWNLPVQPRHACIIVLVFKVWSVTPMKSWAFYLIAAFQKPPPPLREAEANSLGQWALLSKSHWMLPEQAASSVKSCSASDRRAYTQRATFLLHTQVYQLSVQSHPTRLAHLAERLLHQRSSPA